MEEIEYLNPNQFQDNTRRVRIICCRLIKNENDKKIVEQIRALLKKLEPQK